MRWELIRPADARPMPWKNGQGSTLEYAVEPPGGSLDRGFAWRLSSARVAASGPFSRFPGIERWLLLLEGDGFEVDFGPHGRQILARPLDLVRFPGDWPAEARLLGGPSTDLNLMVDPRRCGSDLRVHHLHARTSLPLARGTSLLFLARGTACLPAIGAHLGVGTLARLEAAGGQLEVVPGYGGVELVWARLEVPEALP